MLKKNDAIKKEKKLNKCKFCENPTTRPKFCSLACDTRHRKKLKDASTQKENKFSFEQMNRISLFKKNNHK